MRKLLIEDGNLVIEIDEVQEWVPGIGDYFFAPDVLNTHGLSKFKWHGGHSDQRLWEMGLVFQSPKAAIERGRVLEAFIRYARSVS